MPLKHGLFRSVLMESDLIDFQVYEVVRKQVWVRGRKTSESFNVRHTLISASGFTVFKKYILRGKNAEQATAFFITTVLKALEKCT